MPTASTRSDGAPTISGMQSNRPGIRATTLSETSPRPPGPGLGIEPHEDSEERWLEVYGEDGTLRDDGEPERFALELSPWSKWLGMGVPEELRQELGDAHVVAHCLYEMTTFGFDEESVRAQREELSRRIRALDEMTPEEREEHLIPWEEVKARLEERLKG